MQSATAILSGNLPAEPNSLIGRERDLAELAKLLSEVRALTLPPDRVFAVALSPVAVFGGAGSLLPCATGS